MCSAQISMESDISKQFLIYPKVISLIEELFFASYRVCLMLQYTGAERLSATLPDGIGPIYNMNSFCTGTEPNLVNCSRPMPAPSFCSTQRDVGVVCRGKNLLYNQICLTP